MAYQGTTVGSSLQNPIRVTGGPFAAQPGTSAFSTANPTDGGASPWRVVGGGDAVYVSSHGTTEIMAANFFAGPGGSGKNMGLKPMDVLTHVSITTLGSTPILSFHVVNSVSTAGMSLSSACFISSTYA